MTIQPIKQDQCPSFTIRIVQFDPARKCWPSQTISRVDALRKVLVPYAVHERLVVFLERDGGESVWLHLFGDRAWVSHITEPGGIDSYCCDAEYDGPDRPIEFWLSNGQADEIHPYWTVRRAEAMRALEHFLLYVKKDPGLEWISEPGSLRDRP
jgi:hypothetical protein